MENVKTLTKEGKICNKNKELILKTQNISVDEETCYYLYKNVWYDMLTPARNVEQMIFALSNNENYIFEAIKSLIKEEKFINPILVELCHAANIKGAEESNMAFYKRIDENKKKFEEQKRKKEKEREQKELEAIKSAENDFKNGNHINIENFELLCKKYGVKMHPRTISCLRQYISEVSLNGLKLYERCNTLGVNKAIKELHNNIIKKNNLK